MTSGRKKKHVLIETEGRDKGKLFLLTEMSSYDAEAWARHTSQAMLRAGVELPDGAAEAGMAGIYAAGLKAFGRMDTFETDNLLDQLMTCVSIVRDRAHPDIAMPLNDDDIEEVKTRVLLKAEVFELITGFSLDGLKQFLTSAPKTTSVAS